MASPSAVGVNDDLAAGEAGVAVRPADLEPPRGIDVEGDPIVPELKRLEHGPDDVLHDLLAQLALPLVPRAVVLRREHHRADAHRASAPYSP